MARLLDLYSRDYVRWASRHEPSSWLLELIAFVALALLVWLLVGTTIILWMVLLPLGMIFGVWATAVRRSNRRHRARRRQP